MTNSQYANMFGYLLWITIFIFVSLLSMLIFIYLNLENKIRKVKKIFPDPIIVYNNKEGVIAVCLKTVFIRGLNSFILNKNNRLFRQTIAPEDTCTFFEDFSNSRTVHTGALNILEAILMDFVKNKTGLIFSVNDFKKHIMPLLLEKDERLVVPFCSDNPTLLSEQDRYYMQFSMEGFLDYLMNNCK